MVLTYIRWRDACAEAAADPGHPISEQPLIDLKEVGWLIAETEESVSIALELEPDDTPGRWRLHIPKANVLERRDWVLEDLLKLPRKRRKK